MEFKVSDQRLRRREREINRGDWVLTPPKREYKQMKDYLIFKTMKKYSYDKINERQCASKLLIEQKRTFQDKLKHYYGQHTRVGKMTAANKRQRKEQLDWSMGPSRIGTALRQVDRMLTKRLKLELFRLLKQRKRE